MSRPAGFIILLYLLTFDVNYCIRCDLKTSRKMFKDESGTEWECSIYCPEIRGCKDQCCRKHYICHSMNVKKKD